MLIDRARRNLLEFEIFHSIPASGLRMASSTWRDLELSPIIKEKSLFGIPVIIDEDLPDGTFHLFNPVISCP